MNHITGAVGRMPFWLYTAVLVIVLIGCLAAAGQPLQGTSAEMAGIILKGQQSVMVTCLGDELIVTPYGNQQAEITCRVWVR